MQEPARVAIDLGAESCRVSLLRWADAAPAVAVIHRIPNRPRRRGASLYWPLQEILAGLEEGLRKAAAMAPEGIASIGVDGWSVDYVRLVPGGKMLCEPFCYRDERTAESKRNADAIVAPFDLYQRTGAYPLYLNTLYQLMADPASGPEADSEKIDKRAPWVMLPEFVLYWLSGRRVAEYTNATHTGLVNLKTGAWDAELFETLGLAFEAAPPLLPAGTVLGPIEGPLAALDAFRATEIIAPATHDTASAIAGIPAGLSSTAYISSGTWSLVAQSRRRRSPRGTPSMPDTPILAPRAEGFSFTRSSTACGCSSSAWMPGPRRDGPGPSKNSSKSLPHAVPEACSIWMLRR
jgi:rhamnulokinase